MIKKLGIPKEVKKDEGRVSLIPEHISQFTGIADIFIETGAGIGSGFSDKDYIKAGAKIVDTPEELYGISEIICKVKEPQSQEYDLLKPNHVLFGYLHLASNLQLTKKLLDKKLSAIATEMIMDNGVYPLLIPMSKIAGNLAIQKGMQFLEYSSGGKGILLSSISDSNNAKVTVVGCGEVGKSSIHKAISVGAKVTAIDINEEVLNILKSKYGELIEVCKTQTEEAIAAIRSADLVVGAVLIPGKKPPIVISNEDISAMEKGSVVMDVAIDQGGCVEGVNANTHSDPFEMRDGVLVSAIANLPGAVPKTSSIELSTGLQKYLNFLLEEDWLKGYKENKNLSPSLQIHNGLLLSQEVAESLSLSVSQLV
ncbi:MAG: alanine dehydrogenase [Candidatus Actinomarina sp.]|nr:alanine dehydrogenase [Candidatus Actinomarina sp.]